MSRKLTILVLHHSSANLAKQRWLANLLLEHWSDAGHDVVHVSGVDRPLPPADLVFLHVDLTRVSPEYLHAVRPYPVVVNRTITDVSKPVFSQVMVRPDDSYAGPVIVKTKNNFGGLPEMVVRVAEGARQEDAKSQLSWENIEGLREYPIFGSLDQVPVGIWANSHLLVEKLLPEQDEHGHFVLRVWTFLGDQEIHWKNLSPDPIIKSHNTIRRDPLPPDEVPELLRAIRKQLGVDYGKFDYALIDGKPVLYDINKTPGIPRRALDERSWENLQRLSRGLERFLR